MTMGKIAEKVMTILARYRIYPLDRDDVRTAVTQLEDRVSELEKKPKTAKKTTKKAVKK